MKKFKKLLIGISVTIAAIVSKTYAKTIDNMHELYVETQLAYGVPNANPTEKVGLWVGIIAVILGFNFIFRKKIGKVKNVVLIISILIISYLILKVLSLI